MESSLIWPLWLLLGILTDSCCLFHCFLLIGGANAVPASGDFDVNLFASKYFICSPHLDWRQLNYVFIVFFSEFTRRYGAAHLGGKRVTPEEIQAWKKSYGYDLPYFYNPQVASGHRLTDTLYFNKSLRLFAFHFGYSDQGRLIS